MLLTNSPWITVLLPGTMIGPDPVRVALLLMMVSVAAQVSPEKVAFTRPKISQPLPFKIGETLTYEVTFSKLIFSGTIGELKLSVSKPDSNKFDQIELKAEAVSKGFFPMGWSRSLMFAGSGRWLLKPPTKTVRDGSATN